jgi:putative copper export protein
MFFLPQEELFGKRLLQVLILRAVLLTPRLTVGISNLYVLNNTAKQAEQVFNKLLVISTNLFTNIIIFLSLFHTFFFVYSFVGQL